MNSSRRALLKASLGLAAALAGAQVWAQDQQPKKAGKKGKGRQEGEGQKSPGRREDPDRPCNFTSLRQEFAKGRPPGVLKKVRRNGFTRGWSFWGYEGDRIRLQGTPAGKQWTAEELRALLDEKQNQMLRHPP